jgi:hypothetical protein
MAFPHNASLDMAWRLVSALKFGGLIAIFSGIAVFGWYFVGDNAQAARGDSKAVPRSAWRGRGPVRGATIVAAGFVLTGLAIALASTLPGR